MRNAIHSPGYGISLLAHFHKAGFNVMYISIKTHFIISDFDVCNVNIRQKCNFH